MIPANDFTIIAEKIDTATDEFVKRKADKSEMIEAIDILKSYLERDEVKTHLYYSAIYVCIQTAIAKISEKSMEGGAG